MAIAIGDSVFYRKAVFCTLTKPRFYGMYSVKGFHRGDFKGEYLIP